jgi:hypothetical protein
MNRTQETIDRISALRFPERKQIKNMVASCQLEGAQIDMDKDGFFAHSFTPPQWLVDMPTSAELAERKASEPQVEAKEKKGPVRNVKNGACDKIREWARANPEATPAEGVAHFPDLNPSTVKIQMRKVRMGQV